MGNNIHCNCHDNIVITMNTGQQIYIDKINMNTDSRTKALDTHYVRTGGLAQFIHMRHTFSVLEARNCGLTKNLQIEIAKCE